MQNLNLLLLVTELLVCIFELLGFLINIWILSLYCLRLLSQFFLQLSNLSSSFLFSLFENISLLHAIHELLYVHIEGKSSISVECLKEIWAKVPPEPGNDGAVFVPPLCTKVQLITSLTFQEESARDSCKAMWWSLDENLSFSCLNIAQEDELWLIALKHEAFTSVR